MNMITLRTYDNQEFLIPERAAALSMTIKNMIDDGCANDAIPLPQVDGKTLSQVVVFLNKHADESISDDEKREFDDKFVSDKTPTAALFDYVLAANYLHITDLFNVVSQKIADKMENKGLKWVRKAFNIDPDDFHEPEVEQQMIEENEENEWAFGGVDLDDDNIDR